MQWIRSVGEKASVLKPITRSPLKLKLCLGAHKRSQANATMSS